jgi:RHS repeat-associated protein
VQADYSACRYVFTGREYDAETQNYCYRSRTYLPDLGRFVSRDGVGYRGDMNLYCLVRANSTKYTDPRGTSPCGPNVTKWFLQDLVAELRDFDDRRATNKALFHNRYVDSDLLEDGANAESWKFIVKYQLSYKWMDFGGPSGGDCCNTVEFAGVCIRKNQLGNIAFGVFANLLGDATSDTAVKTAYDAVGAYGTYDKTHPHASLRGSAAGTPRTDNLAAFGVGYNLVQQANSGSWDPHAAMTGDVGRYAKFAPSGKLPQAAHPLTRVPVQSGWIDTADCQTGQQEWASTQSSKDAYLSLRKEFDTKDGGSDSRFGAWLRQWYEIY